jgi:hypothetical protein
VEVGITLEVGFCFEKSINVEGGYQLKNYLIELPKL